MKPNENFMFTSPQTNFPGPLASRATPRTGAASPTTGSALVSELRTVHQEALSTTLLSKKESSVNNGEAMNSLLCFPYLLNSTKIAASFSMQEINKNLLMCISFTTKANLCVNYYSIYINSSNICCKNKNYSSCKLQ